MGKKEIKNQYDYLIIGGGIAGAGVFRELSLAKKSCLLIDKKKFLSQTSSSSSKMLHGGIRYLEKFDFPLVSEALREKNFWLKEKPHLISEKKFFIPVYENAPHSLLKLGLGVKVYDLLSGFKNSPSQYHSKEETLNFLPHLCPDNLKGSVSYYDAILNDKKFGLEIIEESKSDYCHCLEETAMTSFVKTNDGYDVELESSSQQKISVKKIIFATGPFTDQVMKEFNIPWKDKILYSKGSHLFLKKSLIQLDYPIVIQEKKRVIFLIPHKDYHLLGTTEIKLERDINLFDLTISQEEKSYLIENFQNYFPNFTIGPEQIMQTTAGVRPLVAPKGISSSTGPGDISRNHKIYNPASDIFVLIGGKYTTFRVMAKDLLKELI